MAIQDIVAKIDQEANAAIAKLRQESDKQIYDIQKEYEKKREHKAKDIDSRVAANISRLQSRAETYANMEIRNHLLSEKRKILDKVFENIVEALSDSKDYVKILTALMKTAKKHFKEGSVVPAHGKEDETKKAIKESGADYKLAKKATHIKGGFILKSGKIELNSSFEAILENELWGDLEIELSQLLFQ